MDQLVLASLDPIVLPSFHPPFLLNPSSKLFTLSALSQRLLEKITKVEIGATENAALLSPWALSSASRTVCVSG